MRLHDFNPEGRETCPWCAGNGMRYGAVPEWPMIRAACPDCGGTGNLPRAGESIPEMLASVAKTRARMIAEESKPIAP